MRHIVCLILLGLSVACSTIPSANERLLAADALAAQAGWKRSTLKVGQFRLVSWQPAHQPLGERLTVYIEGDGLAWTTPSTPSADPTPRDPVALKLALAQPGGNVVYLGRPCQYIDAENSGCDQRYWTQARFAEEVVDATDQAIEILKRSYEARQVTLVGYSGGGTVAALVAARRADVDRLVTVAGNLNPDAWVLNKGLDPLTGSLSPINYLEKLTAIKQWHFVGAMDAVVPYPLTKEFVQRFPLGHRPTISVIPEFRHNCCWVDDWPFLWKKISFNRHD